MAVVMPLMLRTQRAINAPGIKLKYPLAHDDIGGNNLGSFHPHDGSGGCAPIPKSSIHSQSRAHWQNL